MIVVVVIAVEVVVVVVVVAAVVVTVAIHVAVGVVVERWAEVSHEEVTYCWWVLDGSVGPSHLPTPAAGLPIGEGKYNY